MQTVQLASCSWGERCIDDRNDSEKHTLPSSKRVKFVRNPAEVEFPVRSDAQEDKDYIGDFIAYVPDDVTIRVLSFLDTDKSYFTGLKLVSKAWNAFLSTRWSQLSAKSTLSGLLCTFKGNIVGHMNTRILKVNPGGTAKSYLIGLMCRDNVLEDSNKGILLFMRKSTEELTVLHSSTGVLDHLPCALTSVSSENLLVHMNHGLILSHGCYKVVTLFILSNVATFFLKIFSSDTKEMVEVEVVVPAEVVVSSTEKITSFFSFEGVLYYTILDWLFVYELKDGSSKFIKLPLSGCVPKNSRFVYELKDGCSKFIKLPLSGCVPKNSRFMWQSEGHLYYSLGHSYPQPGFEIWELVLERQHYYNIEEIKGSTWKMICSHFLADIKNECTRLFNNGGDLSVCKPCAFNDDFQILYIELQEMILSYHLKTRLFTKAYNFKCRSYWGWRAIFPFYFGSNQVSSTRDYPELDDVLGLFRVHGKSL